MYIGTAREGGPNFFKCFKTPPIFVKIMYIIVALMIILVKTIINIVLGG